MDTCRIKIILTILCAISLLFSAEADPENLKQKLLDAYSGINTFEAEFVQNNFWPELDKELISYGKIYFDNDHLKLAYTDPEGQFLVLDSLIVTMFDPNSNQAIISASSEIDIRPRSIIKNYWQDSLLVSFQQKLETADIELRTEAGDRISFHTENTLITELTYSDADSNRVTYKFSELRLNQALPENVFDIILPDDVNLLDTRE